MDRKIENLDFKDIMLLLGEVCEEYNMLFDDSYKSPLFIEECTTIFDNGYNINSFIEEKARKLHPTIANLLDRLYDLSYKNNEYWEFCTLKAYKQHFERRYLSYLSECPDGDLISFCNQELAYLLIDRFTHNLRFDYNNLNLNFRGINLLFIPFESGAMKYLLSQQKKGKFLEKLIKGVEKEHEFDLGEYMNLKQKDILQTNFTPKTHVDEYLNNKFNLRVYKELSEGGDFEEVFEPLIFFNLLYKEYKVIELNKDKPTSILAYIKTLNLSDKQRHYFVLVLLGLLDDRKDESLYACEEMINIEFSKLEEEWIANNGIKDLSEDKYDFKNVKKHLEILSSSEEKVKYLIEIKTEYLQKRLSGFLLHDFFDKKCDLEIDKIKKIQEPSLLSEINTTKKIKFHGTQTQFIELIKAMIENENLKGIQKDIISVMCDFFDTKIDHPNKIITDIKKRNNGSETLFLDQLKESLINHINRKD